MNRPIDLGRRNFLKAGAGLTFAIPLTSKLAGCVSAVDPEAEGIRLENAYVQLMADNSCTIFAPPCEMGNGSFTAVPLIAAEEMDVDWNLVNLEFSPAVDELYANPTPWIHGNMLTIGSTAVMAYYPILRRAGAQIRKTLLQMAGDLWDVPATELHTEPSRVVHAASGQSLTYGEVASRGIVPDSLPEVDGTELKDPSEFRLIGSESLQRADTPDKVRGEPVYSIDARLPGMLYATAKRGPFFNRRPVSVNEDEVLAVPGVVAVTELDDGAVAVTASTYEAALKGERTLNIQWSNAAEDEGYDSASALAGLVDVANDLSVEGYDVGDYLGEPGDSAAQALEAAEAVFERRYQADFLYHAQLEPLNAVANVTDDGQRLELWAGTQGPSQCIGAAAAVLGIARENVTLHRSFLGGGFGRRAVRDHDWAMDAVRLSKLHGAPVKSIWSRESDVASGRFKPISAQLIRATETEDGLIGAYHQRIVSDAPLRYVDWERWELGHHAPQIAAPELMFPPYAAMTDYKGEFVQVESDVRVAAMRSVGNLPTTFARESFVDEFAREKGVDPLEFRIRMSAGHDETIHLLEKVAEMSNWGSRPGLGCVLGEEHFALVAEVDLEDSGEIVARRVWVAMNAGVIVHPDNADNQVVGAVIQHLGAALQERITFTNGTVDQSNYFDYQIMRMSQTPEVEVYFEPSHEPPRQVADGGARSIVPAVANALHDLAGVRLRHLPLNAERVLEALA